MKLTNREEQIMDFLWEKGASFVKDIIGVFGDPKPHYNTVSTIVRNLEQKGFIKHEDFGTTYRYSAAVSKEDQNTPKSEQSECVDKISEKGETKSDKTSSGTVLSEQNEGCISIVIPDERKSHFFFR